MNMYYQNVRGLRSKTENLKLSVLCNNYHIIAFTETFLLDSVNSGEMFDDRYEVFRRDRNHEAMGTSDGGGVLLAVDRSLQATRFSQFESVYEDLWVAIKCNNLNLYICCLYIRPSSTHEIYDEIFTNITNISQNAESNAIFLILGDFNLPSISWSDAGTGNTMQIDDLNNRTTFSLSTCMSFCQLEQFNCIPNSNQRYLDLILSNADSCNIDVTQSLCPLSRVDSHHPPLVVHLKIKKVPRLAEKINKRLFKSADYEAINQFLFNIDFSRLQQLDVNQAFQMFYNYLSTAIETFIPLITKNLSTPVFSKLNSCH